MSADNELKIDYKSRMRSFPTKDDAGRRLSAYERACKYQESYGDKICRRCFNNPPNYSERLCIECKQKDNATYLKTKKTFSENKEKVFSYYGRACNCCGEPIEEFLEVDHINNDGAAHRREIKKSTGRGGYIYNYLVETKFKEAKRFQLLCTTCNKAKSKKSNQHRCPHERFKEDYRVMKDLLKSEGVPPDTLEDEITRWVKEEGWEDAYWLLRRRKKL